MENIYGVTFKDFACAKANIVDGMTLITVCETLTIEESDWNKVQSFWNNKIVDISEEEMTFYKEVFINPRQGKFAA